MRDFGLDCSHLCSVVAPDRIPVRGNEHRITRIAFDMFRLDEDKENLWQVQADDDGNEFLVRTYELPKDDALQAKSEWSVVEDGKKASLTVAYHGMPIHRLVAAEYGAGTPDDVRMLRDLIQTRLADPEFADKMLATLPEPKRAALVESLPKLAAALPKIKPVSGKDPLEGIRPDNPKEYDPSTRKEKPLSPPGDWKKHPQMVEDEPERDRNKKREEGLQRLQRMVQHREGAAIEKAVAIAKEMGHGGHFERHELPMVVFNFGGDDAKAKDFLARMNQVGYYGMLVGPGWAAVKLPGL